MAKVLFANLTKQCNMECPRCYLTKESRSTPDRMPERFLKTVLAHPYFSESDEVTVVLQGGEVSILGQSALRAYVQAIKSELPTAKVAMVTNLFHYPMWLQEFAHCELNGRLETTYASGHKMNLALSEGDFQERFKSNLKRAIASGLRVPVNVELNRETILLGAERLVLLALETGARIWEFDFSVHFDDFNSAPIYDVHGYPLVPKSVTYEEFYEFIFLFKRLFARIVGEELHSSAINQFSSSSVSQNFNVQRERDFITINPDGAVTTNPLFSDMRYTFLGNLNSSSFDDCLSSAKRIRRILKEQLRIEPCFSCPFLSRCGGGVSHLPVFDGSSTCVGGKQYWEEPV